MNPPTDAATIDRQERSFLQGMAEMMRILSSAEHLDETLPEALKVLGECADADRVYIFKNEFHLRTGQPAMSQLYEWSRDCVTPQINNPVLQHLPYFPIFAEINARLTQDLPYIASIEETAPDFRAHLASQNIQSIILLPIMVRQTFWGFLGFDDCRSARHWSDAVVEMLRAASVAIGSALKRYEVDAELLRANATLKKQTEELRRVQRVTISLMEDARNAQRKAARASAAKSEFLAVMSHEMRTPLNGILGFADMLGSESDPQSVQEFVSIIRESGRVLLNLISDVLDFSKIESGHLSLDEEPFDPRQLARETVATVTGLAHEKGVTLETDFDGATPRLLIADEKRIRQILLNLIGNAAKFTETGRITLRTNLCEPDAEGGLFLKFEVEDTGIGIAPDALERIFEPFDQADRSVHRRYGGTGLGLSISRSLARLMGGDVTVRSVPGQGSIFTVTIRCTIAKDEVPTPAPTTPNEIPRLADRAPMRILVVDDVATNRLLANRLLARMGYNAENAATGEEAVRMASESPFDLILMDVLMPGIDGCEATRRIRLNTPVSAVRPVVLGVSADIMEDNRTRCVQAGMNGFLTKPIRVPDFVAAVESIVAAKNAEAAS